MTARVIDRPEPGFFIIRCCKGCPEAPAEIRCAPTLGPDGEEMDRSPVWSALLCGEPWGGAEPIPTPEVWRIWEGGRTVQEDRYRLLVEQARWDKQYRPDAPMANPMRPVLLSQIQPSSLF